MKEENKMKEMGNRSGERKSAASQAAKVPQQAEVPQMMEIPMPTQAQEAFPSHDIYDVSGMYGMQPMLHNGMPMMMQNDYMCPTPETYHMPESYVMPQQYQIPQMYMGPMICCPILKQLQCPIIMNGYGMNGMGGMGMPRW
ncbi:MAG TPA: hypothetical protein GXX20_11365 [Clostridiaceae bacterium]|nr:hypothetical protein [Clostridiaceae bacterium]